jgi:hypothetical protein
MIITAKNDKKAKHHNINQCIITEYVLGCNGGNPLGASPGNQKKHESDNMTQCNIRQKIYIETYQLSGKSWHWFAV